MYLFASSSDSWWQKISNFYFYAFGQLKLSDSTFYFHGYDPSSGDLHQYKFTFSNTSPDWALKLVCPSGAWTTNYSESLILSSSIYSFFSFGSTTKYLYMIVLSAIDGSVGTRYKSTIGWEKVYGSGVSGQYIAASVWNNLLIFDRTTNTLSIKSFSGNLFGIGLEKSTGR